MLALDIAVVFILSVLLIKAAGLMISSSSKLARHFGISEYTISFLVISVATSLPELVVGITSAADGKPALSFGNVTGSNIADMTLILAIPIIVGGAISTRQMTQNKDLLYAAFFTLAPIVMLFDGVLGRGEALFLIVSYIFYTMLVLRKSSFFESIVEKFERVSVHKEVLTFSLSVVLLLVSSEFIVKRVESMSASSGIPLMFFGLTLTALGTSLPELAFGLKAVKLHHKGEIMGNIVGSTIANSTIVLGATGLIQPIEINRFSGTSSVVFLLLILLLFFIFSLTGRRVGKIEAAFLTFIYLAFLFVEKYIFGV